MAAPFDPKTFTAYGNAAAGHEGVLSDESGELVIKPCTAAEVSFYESALTTHPEFAYFMPRFMGTLQLQRTPPTDPTPLPGDNAEPGMRLKGKALETDQCIVLENVAAGFVRPNILDLKLGARLWDDDTKPEKRARLDAVASSTTSGSLGFRVAGMRVWQGEEASATKELLAPVEGKDTKVAELDQSENVLVFNKFYGRSVPTEDALSALRTYFVVPKAGVRPAAILPVVRAFADEVEEVLAMLEKKESRMYSASLLFVYEGNPGALKEALEAPPKSVKEEDDEDEADEEEDEEDEVPAKKSHALKVIDFAHATWTPGLGPDENILQGLRSVLRLLRKLETELAGSTDAA
ncbi:SAICAR synthase-like protein [Trichodelitschia bisporula]|uniref:Kinase n=1 Tax=Trichodelitschia bisporula TaxID=703511 RepID=A0A6G1HLC1_9PEZI|nr:SAICAR synthase-like protein [Trichodelitschia bisporula]